MLLRGFGAHALGRLANCPCPPHPSCVQSRYQPFFSLRSTPSQHCLKVSMRPDCVNDRSRCEQRNFRPIDWGMIQAIEALPRPSQRAEAEPPQHQPAAHPNSPPMPASFSAVPEDAGLCYTQREPSFARGGQAAVRSNPDSIPARSGRSMPCFESRDRSFQHCCSPCGAMPS